MSWKKPEHFLAAGMEREVHRPSRGTKGISSASAMLPLNGALALAPGAESLTGGVNMCINGSARR